ncbi:MAG: CocE/NonD family hydrolase [Gemmatimonadales bacterium]
MPSRSIRPVLGRRVLAHAIRLAILLLIASPIQIAVAQMVEPDRVKATYDRRDAMIPMRDGVRLFTTIYTPKDPSRGPYPILLTRTPYGTDTYLFTIGPSVDFEEEGFIFVFQDVRGKYQSEGDFVDVRPFKTAKRGTEIDEASDSYDTIEWLLANAASHNGKVGVWGISYLGFYSTMAALSGHPALAAVSPQAPVTDWFLGDDWRHNGALFLHDAFDFIAIFGQPRPKPTRERVPPFNYGTPDGYQFFLRDGSLADLSARHLGDRIPFWNDIRRHSTYDAFWKARTPLPHLTNVKPAILTVGSWFDAEDVWGTVNVYRAIERQNPGASNALVMGPWFHGQWWFDEGSQLGEVRWGAKTSEDYHRNILLPFFNYHLKGKGDGRTPEAQVFETGTNRWRTFDTWPPAGSRSEALYLGPNGTVAIGRAPPGAGIDQYWSDPNKPVPYLNKITTRRPGTESQYMVEDQRFAATRPDVLVYQTDPLPSDMTIAGPLMATLHVSTTGTDADFVVKLIDVYPDDTPDPDPNPSGVRLGGYQQLLRGEPFRGRFRRSFEKPLPFTPGRVEKIEFELPDLLHTFKAGHRIMIQIQSSWFPLVDRNPQTFVDIFRASDGDYRPAWMRVHRGAARASRVTVGVLR